MVYKEFVESSITDDFIWVYCCDADGDQGFNSKLLEKQSSELLKMST